MWYRKIAQNNQEKPWLNATLKDFNTLAGDEIEGLKITDHIPNMSSIDATCMDYTILSGIRKVPFSLFGSSGYYASDDIKRSNDLAMSIKQNGYIDPLIVVVDQDGPYILEGGHRFDAIKQLGMKFFPALVVLDNDAFENTKKDLPIENISV